MHSVMLVDDEVYARQGLRKLIDWESYGFQVIAESDDGEDALAFIEQHLPDLVITDIRMPVLDGLELIRKCTHSLPSPPEFIIVSGYDDFKYAQQAVRFGVHDFILKPIDEHILQSTLQELNELITRKKEDDMARQHKSHKEMIIALIKGELNKQAELSAAAQTLGLQQAGETYYLLVEVNDQHPWQDQPLLRQSEINEHIHVTLNSLLGEQAEWLLIEHRNQIGLVLPEHKLSRTGDVKNFAMTFQQTLIKRLQTVVYVYVGSPVTDITQLQGAYLTAKDASKYKFVNQSNHVLFYDELKHMSVHYSDLDDELYRKLLGSIEEDDQKMIAGMIARLFAEFTMRCLAPEAVKLAIHRCVSSILNALTQMNIDKGALTTLEPVISWQDLNISPDELKRLLSQFAMESAHMMSQHRHSNLSGEIHKIKQYIESHYHETISLRSIASQFYMSPVYLGQLFKKEYGQYFNEFLLHLRIDEAKRLLRQTDLRIYEIASKVGFNHADYFVTQFAKLESITPSEYRQTLMKE